MPQLAKYYRRSKKWIKEQLDDYKLPPHRPQPRKVVAIADAMFYTRHDGILVFRDPHKKENIHWRHIEHENVFVYQRSVKTLKEEGFDVQALVIDGRKGVREAFPGIPVQMCQFHQWQIVRRYLTNNPKLEASKELHSIAKKLSCSNERQFTQLLDDWINKWGQFLKERTINPETGKKHFTHKRLRSAYFSLRRSLSYLFTYEKYPELNIPKTTNGLEGVFSHIKTVVRIHRGLKAKRKKKLIEYLLRK